ncbi:MAG: beta-ureidopropionase [Armatimonadota bacterium]|nr:beta-ureidopropionase [Armatimonadota bacterium]
MAVTFIAAAVQLAPSKANYEHNLDRVAEAALKAQEAGADLVVFPEAATTGYFLEGGVGDVAVPAVQLAADLSARLSGLVGALDVVLGFYESDHGHIYNAAAHLAFGSRRDAGAPSGSNVEVLHVHRKFFLPTYGVFDEERFVSRGRDVSVYDTRLGKFSLLICEDVWHSVTPMIAALKGATVLVTIAASPARGFRGDKPANLDAYHRLLRGISEEHGVFVINSMLVGFEGGKGFTGGSVVVNPLGEVIAEGPLAEEFMMTAEIDMDLVEIARKKSPLLADLVSVLEDVTREIDDVNEALCD